MTIDPLGHRTTYAYDSRGNRKRMTDPVGRITTTVYDAANRPVASINPPGQRTTTATMSPAGPGDSQTLSVPFNGTLNGGLYTLF